MFSVVLKKLKQDITKFAALILSFSLLLSGFCIGADEVPVEAKKSKKTETAEAPAQPEVGTVFTVSRIDYEISEQATAEAPGKVTIKGNSLKKKTKEVIVPAVVSCGGFEYIPSAVGDRAFVGSHFTSIVFNSDITDIGAYAFAMSLLESFEVPAGVTSIGEGAFALSGAMKSVSIGRYTTTIAQNAFSYCDSLTDIVIDAKNKAYCAEDGIIYNKKKTLLISGAGAGGKVVIPETVKKLSAYAFEGNHKITIVDLGSVITKIPEDAFYDCTSLKKVIIGSQITKISGNPFKYCISLRSFNVDDGNKKYDGAGPMLYSKSRKTLYAYPSAQGSLVIPSSVKNIGEYAFCGCGLTELLIPTNVKSIAKGAFYDCAALEEVGFEKRTQVLNIYVSSLEEMIFGNAMPYLVIVLPYAKNAGTEGSIEEAVKLNSPSTVIIVNK